MKRLLILPVLFALLLGGGVALAQRQAGVCSLDQAVQQVRSTTNGRVLSAQTVTLHGKRVYRVKVLTDDGRVRTVEMNTGLACAGGDVNINPAIRPGLVPDQDDDKSKEQEKKRGRDKDQDD